MIKNIDGSLYSFIKINDEVYCDESVYKNIDIDDSFIDSFMDGMEIILDEGDTLYLYNYDDGSFDFLID